MYYWACNIYKCNMFDNNNTKEIGRRKAALGKGNESRW